MRALALLVVLVCPLYAFAEGEEAPQANWSLGAGISTTVIYTTSGGGLLATGTSNPSATASLERRLSDSNWLVLGFDGGISESTEGSFTDPSTESRVRSRRIFLDFGVRHVLTERGALVDVSLLALGQAGYSSGTAELEGTAGKEETSNWLAGASVGIAVDRELSRGLSLRVATPLAGAWWQKSRRTTASNLTVDGHLFQAAAYLAPRLELRLAF